MLGNGRWGMMPCIPWAAEDSCVYETLAADGLEHEEKTAEKLGRQGSRLLKGGSKTENHGSHRRSDGRWRRGDRGD